MIKIKEDQFKKLCEGRGYTLEEVVDSVIKKQDDDLYVDNEHDKFPHSRGAGGELKKMLKMLGIKSTPNCSCNKRAEVMDMNGTEWCKNNKSQILSWLEEESKKRSLPFIKFGAEQVLNLAISRAEKKGYKK